jgi:hypothetical protein
VATRRFMTARRLLDRGSLVIESFRTASQCSVSYMIVELRSPKFALFGVWEIWDGLTVVQHRTVGFKTLQELRQMGTGKLPREGARLLIQERFVELQTLFDVR